MSKVKVRAHFYRDNFRRLVLINLLLCCVIIGLTLNLFYEYISDVMPPVKHYISTMKGQLIPLDPRLIKR